MNNQHATSGGPGGGAIGRPDLSRLADLFTGSRYQDREQLVNDFLRNAIGLLNAAGAVLFTRREDTLQPAATLLSRESLAWATDMEKQLAALAAQAMASSRAFSQALGVQPPVWLAACPLADRDQQHCLTLVFQAEAGQAQPLLVMGELLAAILSLQFRQCGTTTDNDKVLTALVAEALQAGGREGLLRLTAGLRRLTGCNRVALGRRRGQRMALAALSDVSRPDRRTQESRLLEKGLTESAGRGVILRWPAPSTVPEQESPVLAEVGRSSGSGCVVALPLPTHAGADSALLLLWEKQPDERRLTTILALLDRTTPLLAGVIQALGQRPWRPRRESGPDRSRRFLPAIVVLGLLLLLLVPVPHRVPARALVRPVITRYVVARFDTILEKVLVEPGDQVHAGQLLARLDGREIDLRLAGLIAERNKAARMYDRYLAAGDTPAAQVARLDMERLEQEIDLLHERQQHLSLLSPVDGIVLTGDLKRAQGGPVNKGQTLFEVAPLERMDIELAIGEEDIAQVRKGAAVTIRFDAYPDRRWQGDIQRIIPKSRIRDMRNVFIAEFQAANPHGRLRPGMEGEARIDCGRRCLGWILFHRPWYTLLRLSDQLL